MLALHTSRAHVHPSQLVGRFPMNSSSYLDAVATNAANNQKMVWPISTNQMLAGLVVHSRIVTRRTNMLCSAPKNNEIDFGFDDSQHKAKNSRNVMNTAASGIIINREVSSNRTNLSRKDINQLP